MNAQRGSADGSEARKGRRTRCAVGAVLGAMALLAIWLVGASAVAARPPAIEVTVQAPDGPWQPPQSPLHLAAIATPGAPVSSVDRRRPAEGLDRDDEAAGPPAAPDGADAALSARCVAAAAPPAPSLRFTPRCARAPPA